jgi:hypothetical protein
MPRPDLSKVPEFYHNYISKVSGSDLLNAFQDSTPHFISFLQSIPASKYDYKYAENKWTLKELLQHVIDTERIFCYRALCFARKDQTPLPGFDEDLYAKTSKAANRNWDNLVGEFIAVRNASELLFASFDEEQLNASGLSNNHSNYVLAWGFITIGHCIHHQQIIEERYL